MIVVNLVELHHRRLHCASVCGYRQDERNPSHLSISTSPAGVLLLAVAKLREASRKEEGKSLR